MKLNLLAFETSSSRCGVALSRQAGGLSEVTQLEHEGVQDHAERLLPMAGELLAGAGLAPSDLDAVAFGQGPGAFTGLRVACGVAQGVALGLGLRVVPVVSHLAVAEDAQAGLDDAVLVALDARMEEVYLAVYARAQRAVSRDAQEALLRALALGEASLQDFAIQGGWRVLQAPMLIAAAEVLPWARHYLPDWSRQAGRPLSLLLAGDAWGIYPSNFPQSSESPKLRQAPASRPRAVTVARLAREAWLRGDSLPPEAAAPLYVRDKVAFTTAERDQGQGGNPRVGGALFQAKANAPRDIADVCVLRDMTEADLDEVAALEARVQAFPWTRGNFEDALKSGYPACVARCGGRLAGFCVMMRAPDVTHLLVIAVDQTLRRHGLGRRLVDWCDARTLSHGAEGILLEVRPSNLAARGFYERLGFCQIGVRKGYYPAVGGREDALVLRRDVQPQGRA